MPIIKEEQKALRPYQLEGINHMFDFFYSRKSGMILGDEAGLGKTVQALKVIERFSEHGGKLFLAIVPAFLKHKWAKELEKWVPDRTFTVIVKSYEDIRNPETFSYLMLQRFDLLVFDEMHYLKNFESKRTAAGLGNPRNPSGLVSRAKYVLGISATYIPQRVGEIYQWLWANKIPIIKNMSYDDWVYVWAQKTRVTKFGLTHSGCKDPESLKELLAPYVLRRLQKDVARDLPDALFDYVHIKCSHEVYQTEMDLLREVLEKAGYKGLELTALMESPDFFETLLDTVPNFPQLASFRKQKGLLKIKPIMDFLKSEVLDTYNKFVVSTYHIDVAREYAKQLKADILITGMTPADQRDALIDEAEKKEKCVMVVTMNSVKEGIDLVSFNRIFHTEFDWTPMLHTQFNRRFLRIGQKNTVFHTYFQYDKGIERKIFDTLSEKRRTVDAIID